jgi:hypothetical protein
MLPTGLVDRTLRRPPAPQRPPSPPATAPATLENSEEESDGELSIVYHAYRLIDRAQMDFRRSRNKGKKLIRPARMFDQFLSWVHSKPQLQSIANWATRHSGAMSVMEHASKISLLLASAVTEELMVRVSPVLRVRVAVASAIGLYEGIAVCYYDRSELGQSAGSRIINVVMRPLLHLGLALMPFPAAVVLHGCWNLVAHYGGPSRLHVLKGVTSKIVMRQDIRDAHDEGVVVVGDPMPLAHNCIVGPSPYVTIRNVDDKTDVPLEDAVEMMNLTNEVHTMKREHKRVALLVDTNRSLVQPSNDALEIVGVSNHRLDADIPDKDAEIVKWTYVSYYNTAFEQVGGAKPYTWEQVFQLIVDSGHNEQWKLTKCAQLYKFLSETAKKDGLNVKYDELLKAKFGLIGDQVVDYAKSRPLVPMTPHGIAALFWVKPMQEWLSRSVRHYLGPASPLYVLTKYLPAPTPELVNTYYRVPSDDPDCVASFIFHGDDVVGRYADSFTEDDGHVTTGAERDVPSCDLVTSLLIHQCLDGMFQKVSGGDPFVELLMELHFEQHLKGHKSQNGDIAALDLELLRMLRAAPGTKTGGAHTALFAAGYVIPQVHLAVKTWRGLGVPYEPTSFPGQFENCLDDAANLFGSKMPGIRVPDRFGRPRLPTAFEVRFLGGGFARSEELERAHGHGDAFWVSFGVVKSAAMPVDVYPGTMLEQAAQSLSVVGAQMAGLPIYRLYNKMAAAIMGSDYDKDDSISLFEAYKVRTGKIYHVSMKTQTEYELSWAGFEELVARYACIAGVPERMVYDLFDEISVKMMQDAPDLEFRESWVPFYALRFGELPATRPESPEPT